MIASIRKPSARFAQPLALVVAVATGYFGGYGLAYGIEALSIKLDVNNTAFPLIGLLYVILGLVGIWGVKTLIQPAKSVDLFVECFLVITGLVTCFAMIDIYGEPFVNSAIVQFIDSLVVDLESVVFKNTMILHQEPFPVGR